MCENYGFHKKNHNKAISTTILHCISSSIGEAWKATRAMSCQLMSGLTPLENTELLCYAKHVKKTLYQRQTTIACL